MGEWFIVEIVPRFTSMLTFDTLCISPIYFQIWAIIVTVQCNWLVFEMKSIEVIRITILPKIHDAKEIIIFINVNSFCNKFFPLFSKKLNKSIYLGIASLNSKRFKFGKVAFLSDPSNFVKSSHDITSSEIYDECFMLHCIHIQFYKLFKFFRCWITGIMFGFPQYIILRFFKRKLNLKTNPKYPRRLLL